MSLSSPLVSQLSLSFLFPWFSCVSPSPLVSQMCTPPPVSHFFLCLWVSLCLSPLPGVLGIYLSTPTMVSMYLPYLLSRLFPPCPICLCVCVSLLCVCLGNVYADVPVYLCLHNKLVMSCHDMFVTAFLYNVFLVCLPVCAFLSVRDRMCLCVWLCLLVCLSVQAYGISMPGCFWLCLFRICVRVCLCSQCCRCAPLHVMDFVRTLDE